MLLLGVLFNLSDEQNPFGTVARFRDEMAPGSYLAICHFSSDSDRAARAQLEATYANTPWPLTLRSRDQILRFFDGFELVPPGLVDVQQWRPETEAEPTALKMPGGVGRKV